MIEWVIIGLLVGIAGGNMMMYFILIAHHNKYYPRCKW